MTIQSILKLLVCPLMLGIAAPSSAQTPSERIQIQSMLETYFKGQATGDATHFRKVFIPTAKIEGFFNGKLESWTLDAFCALYNGKPAADEATRKRTVDSIDVTGDSAMAKATLVHGSITFTDYILLLKVSGEWKIANKIFHAAK
jgi:hypothetical protein